MTDNKTIPLFIPAFNNPYYLKQFVDQDVVAKNFTIHIIDNGSTFTPLFNLYDEIRNRVNIIYLRENIGPRAIWLIAEFYAAMPDIFCVSDPDIEFNGSLPENFVSDLTSLTNRFQIGKAGFALDISDHAVLRQKKFRHADGWKHIWESEAEHWVNEVTDDPIGEPIYFADLDTTFALYNKKFFSPSAPFNAIRVGGRFTARHLPWYQDSQVPREEREFYEKTALYSYYSASNPPLQLRNLFAIQDRAGGCPLEC